MMKLTRITPVLFFLAIAMTTPVDVLAQGDTFDHFSTGFVLDGGHVNVTCDACHVSGTFGPTQSSCASCHSNTGLVRASGKPTDHVQTEGECSDCHITATIPGFIADPPISNMPRFVTAIFFPQVSKVTGPVRMIGILNPLDRLLHCARIHIYGQIRLGVQQFA